MGSCHRSCPPGRPRARSRRWLGVGDRSVEQGPADALAALPAIDHEANDGPDRTIVDGRQHLLVGQLQEFLTTSQADPADRATVPVGDQPRRRSALDPLGEGGAVLRWSGALDQAANVEAGAPAPLRIARLVEEHGQVVEPLRRDRHEREVCRPGRRGRHGSILARRRAGPDRFIPNGEHGRPRGPAHARSATNSPETRSRTRSPATGSGCPRTTDR